MDRHGRAVEKATASRLETKCRSVADCSVRSMGDTLFAFPCGLVLGTMLNIDLYSLRGIVALSLVSSVWSESMHIELMNCVLGSVGKL